MSEHSPGDESFMRRALQQAYLGLATLGAGEVGCVIVKDGEVVAERSPLRRTASPAR